MLGIRIEKIYNAMLMIFIVGMFNQSIWNQYSWWPTLILVFMGFSILNLGVSHKFQLNKANCGYIVWLLLLCGVILIVSYTCAYTDRSLATYRNFWRVGLYVVLIIINCREERHVSWILKSIWVAGIVMTIYLLMNFDAAAIVSVDIDHATSTRMGLGGIEHPNTTAYNLFLTYACGFYLLIKKNNYKWVVCLGEVFIVIGCLLTGSRKVLITIVLLPILYIIVKSKNSLKLLGQVILVCVIVWGAYEFILNNEILYNLLGHRIEDIAGIFSGEDKSAAGRNLLIDEGLAIALNHPFGVGLNCMAYYTSDGAYAHNEYIEILADLGWIAFFIYYCPIFSKVIKLTKRAILTKNNYRDKDYILYWFTLLVNVLVLSLFQTSFAFFSYHLVLALFLSRLYEYEIFYEEEIQFA